MKKIIILLVLFCGFYGNASASDTLTAMKERYKQEFMEAPVPAENIPMVGVGDRLEADALLELADEKYIIYKDYANKEEIKLRKSDTIILIMPRVDIFEKHIKSLAKTTKKVYAFFMEEDKLEGVYGDRSYETYTKSSIKKSLPKNVKVFKLKNESVTGSGRKNNFEFGNIKNSLVFKNQIMPIIQKEMK